MSLSNYVTLGRSGLRVSPFCLGTMTFGNPEWGAGRRRLPGNFRPLHRRGREFPRYGRSLLGKQERGISRKTDASQSSAASNERVEGNSQKSPYACLGDGLGVDDMLEKQSVR
jgi:hypothetical protein